MSTQTPLSGPQWRGVYGKICSHFSLKAAQRDQLDESPLYYKAMAFALSAILADATHDWDASETNWRAVADTLAEIDRAATLARDLGMPERPIR